MFLYRQFLYPTQHDFEKQKQFKFSKIKHAQRETGLLKDKRRVSEYHIRRILLPHYPINLSHIMHQ